MLPQYSNMPPDTYQRLAQRTQCDHKKALERTNRTSTRIAHGLLGLMGELGELAGAYEHWIYYGHGAMDLTNLKEELGDVLWYVALLCNAVGLSMDDVMGANISKLRQRFPDKFESTLALEENRDRKAEADAIEQTEQQSATSVHTTRSYPNVCKVCGKQPVHKRNEEGVCVYCVLQERKQRAQSLYGHDYEQTGHGFAEPPEETETPNG